MFKLLLIFAGLVVFGGTFSASAACLNPSPLPAGYAAPCPVWSVSPASLSSSQTLTLSATPQAGTDYLYTTAYYAQGSTWLPVTLIGNNAAPSYSSGPASGSLPASILSTLTPGTNYLVLWDWLWDATAQCYKGPGLNQCNTGTWRVQMFNLTQSTSGPQVSISPTTLTFPATQVGVTSLTQYVSVVNTGTTAITSTLSSFTGDFDSAGTGTCGLTLAIGASCTYSVHFMPTMAGTRTGTLTINDNAPGAPHIISLTGTGVLMSPTPTPSTSPTSCTNCNNYYVSPTGSDSNAGTQASPWKTIGHADSALQLGSGGTIVHVLPGIYAGPITINKSGTASARIVWLSDTKWGAKIINADWTVNGSYTDVDGFDLTSPNAGGTCAGTYGKTSGTAASFVHFINNYCHDVSTAACSAQGAFFTNGTQTETIPSTDNWIIGNIIRHGGNYNDPTNSCVRYHGIYSDGARDIIENNIVSGFTGWGIKRNMNINAGGPGIISNNTVFNNGGGLAITEVGDRGFAAIWDFNTVSNNIIVNNGVDAPNGGRFGINFYHVTGTHNLVTNNLIYGNLPADYAHHDLTCIGGTPISGTDADGTVGGCPASNPKLDSGVTATFTNFQSDPNTTPASNYNPANYQLKAGSNAINNGTTACAVSPGLNPCTPTTDFSDKTCTAPIDIGAYEF